MKSLVIFASLALMAAGVAMADPSDGIWKTEVDDGSYAPVKRTKMRFKQLQNNCAGFQCRW